MTAAPFWSLWAWPKGATALCMASAKVSCTVPAMSLRSTIVVTGSTMSAWRAWAFHHGSCAMIVSGLCQARVSRPRS